jgi:hypothetical protein
MRTSNRSGFRHWSKRASVTDRTAVYGPVCTVVWQGSAGNRCPYADQLLSELPTLPAGYPGTRNRGRAKTAAISANKRRLVNLFSRQTLRLRRGIQISARGVARQCSTNLNTKFPKEAFSFFLSELSYHLIPQRGITNLLLITVGHVREEKRDKSNLTGVFEKFVLVFSLINLFLVGGSLRRASA